MVASAPAIDQTLFEKVPLTGTTLDAAMKMRCDFTGASYAIYWANVGGKWTAVKEHDTAARMAQLAQLGLKQSYAAASEKNPDTAKTVAKVKETGESIFVPNAAASELIRKDLAFRYGIQSIGFEPYGYGVIEFGTTSASGVTWTELPTPPIVPKAELRKAFEELGALYAMFWSYDDSGPTRQIKPVATYESEAGRALQSRLTSDGDSFISRAQKLSFNADGTGPVATAARDQSQVTIVVGKGEAGEQDVTVSVDGKPSTSKFDGCSGLTQRAQDIAYFGIRSIHLVPVEGGVFEYGVTNEATLSDVTLDATIELECEAAGASYAIFWKESRDHKAVVGGSFATPEYKEEVRKTLGLKLDYTEASEAFIEKLDKENTGPIAQALRTRQPVFIRDVANPSKCDTCPGEFTRTEVAKAYNIKSIVFQPVLGGVMEMGKSNSAESTFGPTREWTDMEAALANKIPNAELEAAFRNKGATYAIFWRRNFETGRYELAANFETSDNLLNKDAAAYSESFASMSEKELFPIDGEGPIAVAGRAGCEVVIPDVANYPVFKRRELAKQWGVGKLTLLPCETGVLEYGTVTKDKRQTTVGAEFQEAQRQYRRDVFNGPDWIGHRSAMRFETAMKTILDSGILRARYKEVATVTAFAAFLTVYDGLAGGFTDLDGAKMAALLPFLPKLALPFSFFTLTSGPLGLLLVFRTNACYARWDDARKVWGDIINKCRSVVRSANTFFDDEYPGHGQFQDGRRRVSAETSAFTRCLRTFLRGESDAPNLAVELKQLGFTPDEVAGYMAAGNRQVYALAMLGNTIRNQENLSPIERTAMSDLLTKLCDDVGACERIFKTPIPRVYTGHLSRFVGTWLLFLPLGLYSIDTSWNHLVDPFAAFLITFFLVGIEELGLQIEEPFSILPIEAYCDGSIGAPIHAMVLAEDKARMRKKPAMKGVVVPTPTAPVEPPKLPITVAEPAPAVAEPKKKSWVRSMLKKD